MNVYLRELKARRKSVIFWSIGIFFLEIASMNKFAGFQKSGQATQVFAAFPKGLARAFGLGNVDINTALGWFSMAFMYTLVMVAIHSSLLGAGILAEEEQDKTAEFLYAKPISRAKVVTEKLLAALTLVIMVNIATLLSSFASVAMVNKGVYYGKEISLMMAGMLVVQIIFMVIGSAAAAIVRKPKHAGAAASAIMFATFFLSLWLDITEKLPWLKYFTPYKYFDAKVIANHKPFDYVYLVISIGIIAAMLASTYVFYQRRDLSV
jgi:ABC-2 type transport system permease protein